MSLTFQDWKQEPLIDSNFDEWLPLEDEFVVVKDQLLKVEDAKVLDYIEDFDVSGRNGWLDEFPLFEEIQPFEELKDNHQNENEEKLSSDEEAITDEFYLNSSSVDDLFASSMENTTLVFSSDNIVCIKTEAEDNFSAAEEQKPCQGSIDQLQEEYQTAEDIPLSNINELLKTPAVMDMDIDQWESDSESSSGIPTSSGSNPGSTVEEESDDPEWNPRAFKAAAIRRARNIHEKTTSKRSRGITSQEDRRLRKKEQNKCAATRYRQRKKAEVSGLLKEEEELKIKKRNLEEKVLDIANEIKCLKSLLRDFFRTKGLL
ncbi:hypothetical protein RUM44_004808 [Polyplax serrata]|uniref:BZIP domain-containing protein n=1 Tax=Polyplax serrata TaxID=468196 RepID=A0ABR1B3X9_POLSC